MDKNMCEKITTHPISYIMQGQTDVSARLWFSAVFNNAGFVKKIPLSAVFHQQK